MHKIIVQNVNPLKLMDELTAVGIMVDISFPDKDESNDINHYNDVSINIIDRADINIEEVKKHIEEIVGLHDPLIPQDVPLDERAITEQRIADLELILTELSLGGGI